MSTPAHIIVDNRLNTEKRAVSVYHHATRGAHLISHSSSFTFPLESSTRNDYLHISIIRGPGRLECDCAVAVPLGMDFEYSGEGKVRINHRGKDIILAIPAGPPVWQLKLTRPNGLPATGDHRVTIREAEHVDAA